MKLHTQRSDGSLVLISPTELNVEFTVTTFKFHVDSVRNGP